MDRLSLQSLEPILQELNADLAASAAPARAQASERAATLFGASERLIVYGSLAPGRANYHHVAALAGNWTSGWITGERVPIGWGTELGYSAVRRRAGGERIPAWLLCSAALPTVWDRLDAFEGAAYQRLLAPFETEAGIVAVGYFYAAANGA